MKTQKTQKTLITVMILGAITLSTGFCIAASVPSSGPVPFSAWDQDGSGTIDQQEFTAVREQRQAMVTSSGRMGRNMENAPTFSQIDTDGDGIITTEELATAQLSRRGGQRMGRRR